MAERSGGGEGLGRDAVCRLERKKTGCTLHSLGAASLCHLVDGAAVGAIFPLCGDNGVTCLRFVSETWSRAERMSTHHKWDQCALGT